MMIDVLYERVNQWLGYGNQIFIKQLRRFLKRLKLEDK